MATETVRTLKKCTWQKQSLTQKYKYRFGHGPKWLPEDGSQRAESDLSPGGSTTRLRQPRNSSPEPHDARSGETTAFLAEVGDRSTTERSTIYRLRANDQPRPTVKGPIRLATRPWRKQQPHTSTKRPESLA
ncbi:hypothetical protein NDU88_001983 [Pleurodeles waltl]|uniref:Uncharacterized protein n=1 Tax=Pleurodeles waltl TaxID=8319 RepID=A0AAV7R8P0_PLEWA|nr:hypothetical protein NDU88_001983 [Pleurodeles waltl]